MDLGLVTCLATSPFYPVLFIETFFWTWHVMQLLNW